MCGMLQDKYQSVSLHYVWNVTGQESVSLHYVWNVTGQVSVSKFTLCVDVTGQVSVSKFTLCMECYRIRISQ